MITKASISASLALAGAASLVALFNPIAANALSFNWSFVAGPFSSGQVGQTISGTISGLVEGSNPGTGLTVTVDSTPTGQLLGGGWNFGSSTGGDAFTVTGGAVTFADAFFEQGGSINQLYFGGFGGFYPQLADYSTGDPNWITLDHPTSFTPVAAATTPEPSSVVALLGLGVLGLVGRKLKR